MVDHMINQSGSDLIRDYGPWPSSSSSSPSSSSSYSHSHSHSHSHSSEPEEWGRACLCFQCWHPLLQNRRAHLLPFYAKALIANCKTVWRVFALVMSQCAYLNGSVFLVKTRLILHENCAKSRELYVVFWKKCVLELQFECKAGTVLVV